MWQTVSACLFGGLVYMCFFDVYAHCVEQIFLK